MAISLYDLSVNNFRQILASTSVVLDKGKDHAKENGIDLAEIVQARLAEDMLPFSFQVISVAHHSLGAIEGIKAGVFGPPTPDENISYDALQDLVRNAHDGLGKVSEEEVNALEGNDMRFEFGDFKVPFTAEGFIQSFSLPNFFFHATTTYAILRMKGVDLGKMDFLGQMRVKA